MNLLSVNELNTPDKKHNFFIMEIGREKESYPYYFYNESGVDLNIFIEHVKNTAQKVAGIIVEQYTQNLDLNCRVVDDFTIHLNAVEHMIDFGYKKFKPKFIIIENNPFNFNIDSLLLRNKDNNVAQISEKDDFGVFIFSEWDGLYHDSIRNRFFHPANSFALAHSIVLNEFNKTSDKIAEYKKTHKNFENTEIIEAELALYIKQFYDAINEQLNKNEFKEVFFHNTFLYCNYNFSEKLIPVIGEYNYRRLLAFNEEIKILQMNFNANRPQIENNDSSIDLPF